MSILRNLGRRKLRTTLTILGITIGIVGATCDRIIRMRDGLIVADERIVPRAEAAA